RPLVQPCSVFFRAVPTSPCPCFFFMAASPTVLYTLSLHDALPICPGQRGPPGPRRRQVPRRAARQRDPLPRPDQQLHPHPARNLDRKSTRLNSSHVKISYAVFCLKKKKKVQQTTITTQSSAIHA